MDPQTTACEGNLDGIDPEKALARHMPSITRTFPPVLPPRTIRLALGRTGEPLDEFALEHSSRTPQPVIPWRRASLLVAAFAAVAVATAAIVNRGESVEPMPYLAPGPSPIEVEYPDYPGAPPISVAAAAVAVDPPPAAEAEPEPAPKPRARNTDAPARPAATPIAAEPVAERPFAIRSALPQAVAAAAHTDPVNASSNPVALPADAPPRRIGPPLALTTLGGTVTRNGRLALTLDVTERGEVARIVALEAVDVHPDVIDSISAAARAWRYEPARRAGVAVPARVRVTVELNGGN